MLFSFLGSFIGSYVLHPFPFFVPFFLHIFFCIFEICDFFSLLFFYTFFTLFFFGRLLFFLDVFCNFIISLFSNDSLLPTHIKLWKNTAFRAIPTRQNLISHISAVSHLRDHISWLTDLQQQLSV